MAGLELYTGSFGSKQLKHLLKRTLFGVRKEDLEAYANLSVSQVVDRLLNPSALEQNPPLPINDYYHINQDPFATNDQTWVNAPYSDITGSTRPASFRAWLIKNTINQAPTIMEKMVLMWYNHIPIDFLSTSHAHVLWDYQNILRQNALGNYKTMVRNVTFSNGMLLYLNGYVNTRTAPDENYGRELMELFCIGKGLQSRYTEEDVRAAARVLTGFKTNFTPPYQTFVNVSQHDPNPKVFSSFFGGQTIQGRSTENGIYEEVDDLINMIFSHTETAKYICRKLYRFFLFHNITPQIETEIITPLATIFRSNNYEIKPVLEALFKSAHFYEERFVGAMVKSPMDLVIGYIKELKVAIPTTNTGQYSFFNSFVINKTVLLEQGIFDVPNVSGWAAYYQAPLYYRSWINSNTYNYRLVFLKSHVESSQGGSQGTRMQVDTIRYVEQFSNVQDPILLIDQVIDHLYSVSVSQEFKTGLKNFLTQEMDDTYWTIAWNEYRANPTDMALRTTVESRLKPMFVYLLTQPEYQLH